jgi:dephospho-CoA kinase
MKILLTGIAGAGKSTLVKALNHRDIKAIDLHDIPGVFFWKKKDTGEIMQYSPVRSREWFDTVDRICDIKKLQNILEQNPNTIMAGSTGSGNQKEFLSLFDKIILLQCDPETIIHRMKTRTNKSGYGKKQEEQDDNIALQEEFDSRLLFFGAIPVNTKGEIDDVVQKIIEISKINSDFLQPLR